MHKFNLITSLLKILQEQKFVHQTLLVICESLVQHLSKENGTRMGIMNCLQFELVKFADCCFISASTCKALFQSFFRAVFKDTRRRPGIFVYVNLFVCILNVLFFTTSAVSAKNTWGIKRNSRTIFKGLFFFVFLLAGVMAVSAIYAVKQRKHILCKVWCMTETIILFVWVPLILSQEVDIAWPGISLLIVTSFIKLHGLWVIFYFSLEIKDSPNRYNQERRETVDGSNIKYFVNHKRIVQRRETDQTSIASSPPASPTKDGEENQAYHTSVISVIDDDSPTGNTFGFFGDMHMERDLHYSEIMVQNRNSELLDYSPPAIPSTSKDNIILSDLMCGGSSAVNVESER